MLPVWCPLLVPEQLVGTRPFPHFFRQFSLQPQQDQTLSFQRSFLQILHSSQKFISPSRFKPIVVVSAIGSKLGTCSILDSADRSSVLIEIDTRLLSFLISLSAAEFSIFDQGQAMMSPLGEQWTE